MSLLIFAGRAGGSAGIALTCWSACFAGGGIIPISHWNNEARRQVSREGEKDNADILTKV